MSGLFEFNEKKINGLKNIFNKNLIKLNYHYLKLQKLIKIKIQKKKKYFNLVESLDIFALIKKKK